MRKLFVFLFVGITLALSAQPAHRQGGEKFHGGARHAKMKKMDWAKHYDVKAEDTVAFKALCKEYFQEKKAIQEKYRGEKLQKGVKPTEEQMDDFMKNRIAKEKAQLALKEKYYAKFRRMLSPWHAARLLQLTGDNGGRQNMRPGKADGRHGKPHRDAHLKHGKKERMEKGKCQAEKKDCCNKK